MEGTPSTGPDLTNGQLALNLQQQQPGEKTNISNAIYHYFIP